VAVRPTFYHLRRAGAPSPLAAATPPAFTAGRELGFVPSIPTELVDTRLRVSPSAP